MMQKKKCKICRRLNEKLFLKGDRCMSTKCAMIKRPFAPGQKAKKRRSTLTEYGKELREKQKMKKWYNLSESQLKKYVKQVESKRGRVENAADALIQSMELRLDNIIFRLGLAKSRSQASKLVSHGHFTVNNRKVDIPSCQVKLSDVVGVREGSKNKAILKEAPAMGKNYVVPSWLNFDQEKIQGKIIKLPKAEDIQVPAEMATVFEHYSR